MRLKVCGMKYSQNIMDLVRVQPEYMGFIFYPKSKRYVGDTLDASLLLEFPKQIEKVAVVVNSTVEEIQSIATRYAIHTIQLHGDERPEFCAQLKALGFKLIKAFSVDANFDFATTLPYRLHCDYFLFDTKGEGYGGTGHLFDWNLLENYDQQTPFFLSGGIDADSVQDIKKRTEWNIHAVDVNSKFELEPALKDIEKIKQFKLALN